MGGAAKSFSAPCVQLFMNLLHVGRYFKDPNVAPKSKKVHARCDVKGKP